MFLTLLPAPKWTKLTRDVRYNIVIEHVKKNGGAFSTFKKSQPKHSYALANSICPEGICLFVCLFVCLFIGALGRDDNAVTLRP